MNLHSTPGYNTLAHETTCMRPSLEKKFTVLMSSFYRHLRVCLWLDFFIFTRHSDDLLLLSEGKLLFLPPSGWQSCIWCQWPQCHWPHRTPSDTLVSVAVRWLWAEAGRVHGGFGERVKGQVTGSEASSAARPLRLCRLPSQFETFSRGCSCCVYGRDTLTWGDTQTSFGNIQFHFCTWLFSLVV